MGLSLTAYLDELNERTNLLWPAPPEAVALKTTPFVKPLPGIRAVTWDVYGTLLRIDQGHLEHRHPQDFRMQIALDKTIKEFNMWYSMSRKPGQPWEYMLRQYETIIEDMRMVSGAKKGDVPEIDSAKVWLKIIQRLEKNEYSYDVGKLGDEEALAQKIAYFFHANLQGVEALPNACQTLLTLQSAGIRQGLLADGQSFTMGQLFHQLKKQLAIRTLNEVLAPECVTLSYELGVRKPSLTLFKESVRRFRELDIEPEQVLHVSHRLKDDLAVAKGLGFKTCLLAEDKNVCDFDVTDVRNPEYKPDRLISQLKQITLILGL